MLKQFFYCYGFWVYGYNIKFVILGFDCCQTIKMIEIGVLDIAEFNLVI